MDANKAKENRKKANKELSLFYKQYKVYLINMIDKEIDDASSSGLAGTEIGTSMMFDVINRSMYPKSLFELYTKQPLLETFLNNLTKHYKKLGFNVSTNTDGFDTYLNVSWEEQ